MAKGISGSEKFHLFFENIYGERWEELIQALIAPTIKIAHAPKAISNLPSCLHQIEEFPAGFYWIDNPESYPQLRTMEHEGLSSFYLMDYASSLCALSLEVAPGDRILDMCAAPGGKSLILARNLNPTNELICNEFSRNRKERLRGVLKQYLPTTLLDQIKVTGSDAATIGIRFPEQFDKILLDAPCSGERHLLQTPKELEKWSPKRTSRLAQGQYAMLCSALLALKPQGQMVYSTCSISPMENDSVIAKLLSKKSHMVQLDIDHMKLPEMVTKTEYGFAIFPDVARGHGPIYFTRFRKI